MTKIFISPIQSSPDAFKLITSELQANRIINGKTRDHKGNDYGVPTGTPISAIGDGKVIYSDLHKNADKTKSYGNLIVIEHIVDGQFYHSRYAHLSARDVKIGNSVKAGQVIGKSGGEAGLIESGNSTGPHLHLELRKAAKEGMNYFDPELKLLAPNEYINYKQFSLKQQVEKLDGQYELEFRGNLGSDYISALGDQLFINDESLSGNALPLTNKNTNEIVPNIWKLTTNTYKREYILTRLDQNNKISSNGTKLLINPLGATNTENCIIINNFPFSESIKSAEEAANNNGVSTTTAPFGIKLSKNNQIDFSKIEFNQLSRSVGDIGSSAVNDNKIFSRKITKSIRKIILSLTILLMASLITIDTTQAKEIKKEQDNNKLELQNQKITYSKAEEEVVLKKIYDLNKNPRLEYGKYLTKKEMLIRLEMMKKKKEYDMGWYERMIKNSEVYKNFGDEVDVNLGMCNPIEKVVPECSLSKFVSTISQDQVISILINCDDYITSSNLKYMLSRLIISALVFGVEDYVDRVDSETGKYYSKTKLTGRELDDMIENRIIINNQFRGSKFLDIQLHAKSIITKLQNFLKTN